LRYYYEKIRHHFDLVGKPCFEYVVMDSHNSHFTARSFDLNTARRITAMMNATVKQHKIVGLDYLLEARKQFKTHNSRVVFTNGCFRLLHAGHAFLLDWAKQQGDLLIVGVNSDESAYRLKGPGGYPLAERMEILAALACVDYVVSFDDDTPYDIIEALKPDILVKGSECAHQYIPGSDLVSDVRIAPEGPFAHLHATKILEAS
jgi:D-beta-D-heptose 7-phosphate kinase/D-beta-D-heptose 1-phosphate adenosyltransferase